MRLLFDHSVPSPLCRPLNRHEITLARERGWDELVTGQLIAAAEGAGFEVLVTCDKNWRYQQNLAGRRIGIAVLSTNSWPQLQQHAGEGGGGEGEGRAGGFRRAGPASSSARSPPAAKPGNRVSGFSLMRMTASG